MPSSSIIIPFRNLLSVLLFLPLVLSCRQDEPIPPVPPTPGKGETAQMTLSIRVPDFRAANTRGVYEDGITEITVLMFADEGGTEKVKAKYDVPSSSLHTPSGTQDTKFFSVPVTAGTYKRIALIANAQTELAGITAGSTYEDLKQVEVTGRFGQKGGTGTSSYIPMYGEHAPAGGIEMKAGVSQTIAQAIPLIRMLARVDIINPATSGATTAGNIYICNPIGNGLVWVDFNRYNINQPQMSYYAPTLPNTLYQASSTHVFAWTTNTSSPNVITYYLNEQPATSPSLGRPSILLQLIYQGRKYWYRLDYTWDGIKGGGASPYEKGKYMPILRNHRYIFTIKEVKGPGFLTMEDALNSPENFTNHNIVVVPIVIDEAFTDITFNELGYFLAVTRTAMTLQGKHEATSIENKTSVQTNYPGGWKAKAYNADGTEIPTPNPWLKPGNESGALAASFTNPVTEELQAITNGKGFKDGYLEIRAGRLNSKINVKQLGKFPLQYVAETNLAGGSNYGSSFSSSDPAGISPTGAQTNIPFMWAVNHNNNESGYYKWHICKGITDPTGNPSGKNLFDDTFFTSGAGKGYHLPSRWEWAGVFCHEYNQGIDKASSTDHFNINEAIEWGGKKATFANDYCNNTGTNVCYALRFKAGTGNPNDGSSTADFPLASDNSMLCAYRYEFIGNFSPNDLNSQIKVQGVHLGNSFIGDINVINKESWWNAQSAIPNKVITRIFPINGEIRGTTLYTTLYNMGENAYYQSSSEHISGGAWQVSMTKYSSTLRYDFDFNINGKWCPVRLFSAE